jgi:activator of HSP90 ATPase
MPVRGPIAPIGGPMNDRAGTSQVLRAWTRRRMVGGVALAIGGGLAERIVLAQAVHPQAGDARTSLHQEVDLGAAPERIYELLLSSKEFAACSGLPAVIDGREGGAFTMFGGQIVGRTVELVPGKRVVQAWRPPYWEPGMYSMVRFALAAAGAGTHVALDHTGFPQGDYESLSGGWVEHYWDRMRKFLA